MSLIDKSCPNTIPSDYCFYQIFNTTYLYSIKDLKLPATTLTNYCYSNMFNSCEYLIDNISELPATTLSEGCYYCMYYKSVIKTAPELPALKLIDYCYSYMFYNCYNLNSIKAMFITEPSETYTAEWVTNVSSTGTFVKNSAATWNITGSSGIPSGWTVETVSA